MPHQHNHETDVSSRIGWAFFLNVAFTIVEFIGGWLTNSVSIMADAVHDLGDSISIGLAWALNKFSQKEGGETYTYGFRRFSLLGALINGLVLVIGSVWVLSAAIPRLSEPVMPMVEGMFGLAIVGITINGYAAYKLSSGKSLNERVLNWHLMEDVLGWVAVLLVSITMMFVDWPILDPLLSIIFTLFILVNVLRNLRSTFALFFQATPDTEMKKNIRRKLLNADHVDDIHHFHFWSLDGEHHVVTAHLVLRTALEPLEQQELKNHIAEALDEYHLAHTTIELEFPEEPCRDKR